MSASAISRNGVTIRLNDERWQHILVGHPEVADNKADVLKTVSHPERILEGSSGELLAVREVEPGKWLVVAYREQMNDGFIITAYLTRRLRSLNKRRQIWS